MMRVVLRRVCCGVAAFLAFRAVLWALYAYVLPDWYTAHIMWGDGWSVILAALPVAAALLVAGPLLLVPT